MHTLAFTLSPEGVVRVHDAVVCLSKFSESVSLEARHDKVPHHSTHLVEYLTYIYLNSLFYLPSTLQNLRMLLLH